MLIESFGYKLFKIRFLDKKKIKKRQNCNFSSHKTGLRYQQFPKLIERLKLRFVTVSKLYSTDFKNERINKIRKEKFKFI